MADAVNPTLSWNVVHDVGELLEYHFMINALLAVSGGAVLVVAVVGVVALGAVAALARPLLFASVDAGVAAARGVPVRLLSLAFLLVLGLAVGATSQITGVLLVFALLVAPA